MKQTAVEWLVEELKSRSIDLNKWNGDLVEQAKEMEKQQIIDAYIADLHPCSDEDAEQYYNETFNNED